MLKYFTLAFILFSLRISFAQQLVYTVDLDSTATHKVHVEISLHKMGAKTVTYQMPIWAPGAYSVTHYGHYISDFTASDEYGHDLPVKQVNDDRWEIYNAKKIANIDYTVRDSHKDSTSLYFALAHIDTNFFFANGTCLFGYVNDKKNIPSLVIYKLPKDWKIATALDSTIPAFGMKAFKAKNYDELVDAPVMADTAFQTRSFKDGKATYDIVLASNRVFPMDSLAEYTHKIVHAETEFFHDTPFKHYTFLIYAPTFFNSPSAGQGALEHANSSDYLLINLPWKQFKGFGPQILAHEFFHLWNVKRIHSSLLGPFDYTKRVMTTSLWLSEGITDYYSRTILTRWNILPYRTFEESIKELTFASNNSKTAKKESLEQLSIDESDFDISKATVFYFKGTLVGLLLDIEIRSRTDNKKSLDDVMFALYTDAKKGKTFKDTELIGKMEKITGLDLQDFYHKYIAGTDSLPIDSYMRKMGMGNQNHDSMTKTQFTMGGGIKLSDKNEMVFNTINPGGVLDKAGIEIGDTVKQVNGKIMTFPEFIQMLQPPVTIELDVAHLNSTKHVSVTYDAPKKSREVSNKYTPFPDATPLEVAIRHGIVGKDY
jgi:predicted metalloprotease with PDZ domain